MLHLRDILGMSSPLRLATMATLAGLLFVQPSHEQTYSKCDPLHQQGCSPDPALGKSIFVDFTAGASNEFTEQGNPTYGSEGVSFTVAEGGDAPTIVSNWYIMFGKYEVKMKAAPGAGIVSSLVAQSDDLDEIDWEFLGAQNDQVQSNYFGKGQTTTYNRMEVEQVSNSQGEWHDYTIEWTEESITWQIDGSTVRVLEATKADGQYPQTPCQLKIGAWSGGDSSNPPGTIHWAQGPTDYSDGPFTMVVASIAVTDYSTGSQYTYGDQSGGWTSIESKGGRVNGNVGAALAGDPSPAADPPSTASGTTEPFWRTSTGPSATVSATSYPGLPSGWAVNPTSGKVVPPSGAAPATSRSASSMFSPVASPAPHSSACGYETVTTYDDQGFLTTATLLRGIATGWNERGFPTTVYPTRCGLGGFAAEAVKVSDPKAGVGLIAAGTKMTTTPRAETTPTGRHPFAATNLEDLQRQKSGGSTLAPRWIAAVGIIVGSVVMI